ncbi:hypothetical protein KDH_49320 [Dictyobacter sp. S3.2.2.5]|uniref:DUF304 domain-containing protein n=1 Tax=Dictyobacter halimunensis TaxID=3026934 RepID=A0ABQ6FWX4_9CHLR|nr:hypothetical protein KDH_49320 [Dictyobacter sp. S3.2.2.5]
MAQSPYAPSATASIPAEVQQMAAYSHLGNFRNEYRPSFTNPLAIIGILIGSIVLDIAVLVALITFTGYLFYYLLIVPVLVLIWAINALKHYNWRIYLFNGGYIHARGSQLELFRWDQIQAVYVNITRSRSRVNMNFQVRRSDGALWKYGSAIKGHSELGAQVQEAVTRVQLPRVVEAFNSGAQIPFGRLNVNAQGINDGKKIIPWDQIGTIEMNQGKVAVRQNGRLLTLSSIKASEVPNFNLLMSLAQYVTSRRQPQAYPQY